MHADTATCGRDDGRGRNASDARDHPARPAGRVDRRGAPSWMSGEFGSTGKSRLRRADGQALAPLRATAAEDLASVRRLHAGAEPVHLLAAPVVGLERALQDHLQALAGGSSRSAEDTVHHVFSQGDGNAARRRRPTPDHVPRIESDFITAARTRADSTCSHMSASPIPDILLVSPSPRCSDQPGS